MTSYQLHYQNVVHTLCNHIMLCIFILNESSLVIRSTNTSEKYPFKLMSLSFCFENAYTKLMALWRRAHSTDAFLNFVSTILLCLYFTSKLGNPIFYLILKTHKTLGIIRIWCGSKEGHQKGMCLVKIGLHAQNILTILGWIVNMISGRPITMSTRIFTLILKKIFVWASKTEGKWLWDIMGLITISH
jgi:hypothetical protein